MPHARKYRHSYYTIVKAAKNELYWPAVCTFAVVMNVALSRKPKGKRKYEREMKKRAGYSKSEGNTRSVVSYTHFERR